MSRHFSTRQFFRQMPNAMLARYFASREVLQDFNFASMKEARIDPLFDAWMGLPEVTRLRLEAELREIWGMSCEAGMKGILDEAEFHLDEESLSAFREKLMGLPGHHERAMVVFLDHSGMWLGAKRFHHADMLSYWRKRKNLPKVKAAVDQSSLTALEASICEYYRVAEGRGLHCKVECYRRGDRDYFFAFPEDYAQQSVEWEGDQFAVRSHNPAFEVVFVFREVEGALDLYVSGSKKAVRPLQAIFAEHILKCPKLPDALTDHSIYDLSPLGRREFGFTWPVGNGIESVAISNMRLALVKPKNSKLILAADAHNNPKAVYDLLDALAGVLGRQAYVIDQVGITAHVKPSPAATAKSISFSITQPNSCSLKYDEIGLKLRAMLKASGIDPKEPGAEEAQSGFDEDIVPPVSS